MSSSASAWAADREMALTLTDDDDSIPQTLVIDAGGHVVKHWSGYPPGYNREKLKQAIDKVLETAQLV